MIKNMIEYLELLGKNYGGNIDRFIKPLDDNNFGKKHFIKKY